jgi:hypothetical protein
MVLLPCANSLLASTPQPTQAPAEGEVTMQNLLLLSQAAVTLSHERQLQLQALAHHRKHLWFPT